MTPLRRLINQNPVIIIFIKLGVFFYKMKLEFLLSFLLVAFLISDVAGAEKAKKKSGKKSKKAETEAQKPPESKMFDSATLKCLVCRSVLDEFRAEIFKVDPKKMIDTGTFRINDKGEQARSIVSLLGTIEQSLPHSYQKVLLHLSSRSSRVLRYQATRRLV